MTLYSPGGLNLADTTAPLILAYDDGGTTDVVFAVSATGDLTITPDGGDIELAATVLVTGDLFVSGGVIHGALIGSEVAGAIEWNGANFRGYTGTVWVNLDAGASSSGGWVDDGTVVRLETATDDVHIGAATAPGAKLKVTGTFIATVSVTANGVEVSRGLVGLIGNTLVGNGGLGSITTGDFNTAIGYFALKITRTGHSNTAIGNQALDGNTGGSENVAVGRKALLKNQNGTTNIAVGVSALHNTTGSDNTGVGHTALTFNTNGSRNVALGASAGSRSNLSDRLYIDNQDRGGQGADQTKSLIYGVFDANPANQLLTINAALTVAQSLKIVGDAGFYNQAPVAKPTGVAVNDAAIHAALVTLNLIAA